MVATAIVALLLVTFDIFSALRRPSLLVVVRLLLLIIIITIHQIDDVDDVGDALRLSGNSGNAAAATTTMMFHRVVMTLGCYGISTGRTPPFLLGAQFKLSTPHW